ncbi:hypothetical protein PGT21_029535 [Puccinia graminis f. sp. tritici]|uniref:Uncharacterized protein n=1 Tax=Puccinia graminis f. sp. tritici TaxID=56615 RepID=A0A5B0R224_PUCGR|nr:hypothetical protein PGT21_029535 [Puccinia graminis f. sp. tritici]
MRFDVGLLDEVYTHPHSEESPEITARGLDTHFTSHFQLALRDLQHLRLIVFFVAHHQLLSSCLRGFFYVGLFLPELPSAFESRLCGA